MIIFENGIQGLSDTKWQGARGQANRLVGIDYRSKPGIISVNQKLTKDSGSTIDEFCKIGLPVSDGSNLWFSSVSGKIWREVDGVYTLINTLVLPEIEMPLESAVDSGKSKNISTQINIPKAIVFKPNGLVMYVLGVGKVSDNNGEIFQYTLTTAFDVSTATYTSTKVGFDAQAYGMAISTDGTKLFISEDGGGTSVITYTLSTPWDITTAGVAGASFNFSAQGSRGYVVNFKSDGLKMYIFFETGTVSEYNLSLAWNVTTAVFVSTFSFSTSIVGGFISPDGTKIYKQQSSSNNLITEYRLSTAFDVSTMVATGKTFTTVDSREFAMAVAQDGLSFYVATQDTETVYQYSVEPIDEDLNVTILGAEEFSISEDEGVTIDSYIYFATKNWLFNILVSDISSSWNYNFNYLTLFKHKDDTYHPMKKQNNKLFIGDKYVITEVNEAGVVTLETDFNVQAPERITTLGIIDTDLLVGTKETKRAWVKRWDTEALSWFAQDSVEETEIYGFLPDDNYVYVLAGDFGHLYFYDGEKMHKETRVPGEYSKTKRSKINQNAVASFFGIPLFGVSNLEGNPSWQGLYSYGRFSKDYNVTMDLSYPLSCDEFSDIEIGAIIVQGYDILVSWKTATQVGIDRIDWTQKYESAFIETMILLGSKDRSKFKSVKEILADYYLLPENTGLEFSIENNYQGFVDIEEFQKIAEKLNQVQCVTTRPELGAVAVMFEFNIDNNNAPEIENFHVNFVGEQ